MMKFRHLVLLIVLFIMLAACTAQPQTVEVTRIVNQELPVTVEVTRVVELQSTVEVPVEVTRLVEVVVTTTPAAMETAVPTATRPPSPNTHAITRWQSLHHRPRRYPVINC